MRGRARGRLRGGAPLTVATAGRKQTIARLLGPLPLGRVGRALERRRSRALVVNLHSVPARHAGDFRALLGRLADRFALGEPEGLEDAVRSGVERPTLFLAFDDGLANHAEVAAPILAEHGARAIFCLPADFLDAAPTEQLPWFRRRVYPRPTELHRDEDIRALTWEQAAALAEAGHRIASHGSAHVELTAEVADDVLEREIVGSRETLEARLAGVTVDGFCWPVRVHGDAGRAARLVRETYAYSLGGAARSGSLDPVGRLNLEASWPWRVVELQLLRAALAR